MPVFSAHSSIESRACFFVPTKRILPPRPAISAQKSVALLSSFSVWRRSMTWMPSRSPWM
jgi:hypothetical protein